MNNQPEQIFLLEVPADLAQTSFLAIGTCGDQNGISPNACRTCATVTQISMPIFYGEGIQNNLAEKIQKHLPIQVSPEDGLPQSVCYQCVNMLLAWHELVECCVQADQALRQAREAHLQKIELALQNTSKEDEPQPEEINTEELGKEDSAEESAPCDPGDFPSPPPARAYARFYRALVKFRDHFLGGDALPPTAPPPPELDAGSLRCGRRSPATLAALRASRSSPPASSAAAPSYRCGRCGRVLRSAAALLRHLRAHSGARPCVCHVCGARFAAPGGLGRHLKETHERARRPACPLCALTLANATNLRHHLRTHTGERPYCCGACGRRFAHSGSLHAHGRTHAAPRPHVCDRCGAAFTARGPLLRHRRRHDTAERTE